MAALVGATVARADDDDRRGFDDRHHGERGPPFGLRPGSPPPDQNWGQGRYELQTVQTWVAGQEQEVWVPAQCRQQLRFQHCTGGYYRTVATPGRYETHREWVWVATSWEPGRGPFGPRGFEHGAVPAVSARWGR